MEGEATLRVPVVNGIAYAGWGTIEPKNQLAELPPHSLRKIKVPTMRPDQMALGDVGFVKIDVEGHELSVLKGAERALARHAIRDIIFEDFQPMLSPTAEYLKNSGFALFQLVASWWKPFLKEVHPGMKPATGSSYNYLATLDPKRANKRFQSGGWHCLSARQGE